MLRPTRVTFLALALPLLLLATACGADDGADVRATGTSSGSASGSGTHAHGSGSASGSATGHASGTAVAECAPVGGALEPEATTEVAVRLGEWHVTPDRDSVKAGVVTFALENEGEDVHEFAVVRGKSADDLPLADDGTVDLESMGDDFLGEVEAFPAGESCSGTFELPKGDYVLLCNLLHEEDGEVENHFELGMHTEFTVR
ncbi:MAG TPA: hypothetical protein VM573_01450 [Actinomycetota bacterium]|jgi:uncharacterized cupredoxin-like copper-binding protein|nr:hypothetical protein [Actinomycetota bacterium]